MSDICPICGHDVRYHHLVGCKAPLVVGLKACVGCDCDNLPQEQDKQSKKEKEEREAANE